MKRNLYIICIFTLFAFYLSGCGNHNTDSNAESSTNISSKAGTPVPSSKPSFVIPTKLSDVGKKPIVSKKTATFDGVRKTVLLVQLAGPKVVGNVIGGTSSRYSLWVMTEKSSHICLPVKATLTLQSCISLM